MLIHKVLRENWTGQFLPDRDRPLHVPPFNGQDMQVWRLPDSM